MEEALLRVENLSTAFTTESGIVHAVNDISFDVLKGQTVCIVGESGCGKSATAMSIMGLHDASNTEVKGSVYFEGNDVLAMKKNAFRNIRGNDLAMIFQEPMTSLNPILTIGEQLMEPLREHQLLTKKEAKKRAIELIELVGIGRSRSIFKSYPHQLSGGMLQRIMIAIALSCDPKLLIADEPTTALDVTIQAQILNLLQQLKEERKMGLLFITHDLGVVAEIADYVLVMYAGKVVEHAPVVELFKNPKHPYTKGLLAAKPILNERKEMLYTIPGQVPNLVDLASSCYFSDRCGDCFAPCKTASPSLQQVSEDHAVSCWLYEEVHT